VSDPPSNPLSRQSSRAHRNLTSIEYSEESLARIPEKLRGRMGNLETYNDSPYLSAMSSVALCTGMAKKALRGKYFDVGQDLEDVIAQTEAIEANPNLYALHTTFLGGLSNGGGMAERPDEAPFEFPGF